MFINVFNKNAFEEIGFMRYLFDSRAVFQFNSFLRFVNTIRIHSIPVCSGCDAVAVALMESPESLLTFSVLNNITLTSINSHASMPKLSS